MHLLLRDRALLPSPVPVPADAEGARALIDAASYSACETLDMLKSGMRSAGVAVREK